MGVKGAIRSYQHRIAPKLEIGSAANMIQDSLKDVCERIAGSVNFVHKLAADKNKTCPFQYDVAFAFDKVVSGDNPVSYNKDQQDDEEDDEDDEDEKGDAEFFDCFANIK